MPDISIDEAKAKQWIVDSTSEINAVEIILTNVASAVSTVAGSDDTIMEGIYKVGTKMESVWKKLCNAIKESSSYIEESITKIVAAGQEVIDETTGLGNKIE